MDDDYGNPLSDLPSGDQPGDYPMPTNPQTPGAFGGGSDYSHEGDNYRTPGSTQGVGGSPVNASTTSGLEAFLRNLVGGLRTSGGRIADRATNAASDPSSLLTALAASYIFGGGSEPRAKGYTGPGIATNMKATREMLPQAAPQPYGSGRMGKQYFAPIKYAAQGGIMGMASGGASAPQYLRGSTDGMADKLDTTIDNHQPAKLSHGEFVVPADVVSHLGNGNSDAGADVLYKMMNKVRKARTGNPKQGKRINPDKFTPGGNVGYAGGGIIAFAGEGSSLVPTTGQGAAGALPVSNESNLSAWAGPYITNMLSQGQALANTPYQAYTGALTAGASPLQTQAFNTASNLSTPTAIGQAAQSAGAAGSALGSLSYNPYTATNAYSSPAGYTAGQIGNTYTGTGAYNPQAATNQYASTSPYTGSNISTDQFNTANMQQYMNPYMQMSLDPQIAEARRQQAITNQGSQARLAQAGAYGGSRDAIMRSEADRNLSTNLANITGQGYNTAYNTALGAFNTQQQMGLQAQQANEASRQFGANQALTNAQNTAQYGNMAQQLNAQQQQFGANQALTNAQNAAQYGLAGFNANQQAQQAQGAQSLSNAQNAAQYGNAAQQANIQQQQFGANYGLQGLMGQLQAAQTQGNLGGLESQTGLSNLNALLGAGATQRGIESEGVNADLAQFNREQQYPYQQLQFQQGLMSGLPIGTNTVSTGNSGYGNFAGNVSELRGLYETLQGLGLGVTP